MAQPKQYQGMPLISTPIVDSDGTMNINWYRFFQSLWTKSGLGPYLPGATANRIEVTKSESRRGGGGEIVPGGPNASVAYALDLGDFYLNVYDIQTGEFIGRCKFSDQF